VRCHGRWATIGSRKKVDRSTAEAAFKPGRRSEKTAAVHKERVRYQ